jgi:hypothetical protein
MHSLVTLHLAVGILAIIAALTLVWRLPGRRIVLYVLTLQILLGLILLHGGYRAPPAHILSAFLAWALYMAANALTRRQADARLTLGFVVAATVLVVIAGALGGALIAHPARSAGV